MVAETTERGTFDAPAHMRKIRTKQGMVDYLDVKFRVLWLRAEHPDASIVTEAIYANEREACMKATVSYALGERVVMATGHGSETAADFPSGHIEKAETKAIGRACAVLGYGTDAAADFDDGEPMDGRAAAKDERAARGGDEPTRLDDRQRKQVDAQHERNLPQGAPAPPQPPPSRLPATRRPPQPESSGLPADDDDLAVLRDELRELGTRGFDLNRFLTGRNKELDDLTRGELEHSLPMARDVVRKRVEKLGQQL
jgi:hypothetical protein